jgi:hypothetical protein
MEKTAQAYSKVSSLLGAMVVVWPKWPENITTVPEIINFRSHYFSHYIRGMKYLDGVKRRKNLNVVLKPYSKKRKN